MQKLFKFSCIAIVLSFSVFYSCNKEVSHDQPNIADEPVLKSTDRSCDDYFAITAAPNSVIMRMDPAFSVVYTTGLTGLVDGYEPVTITDLKGIARFVGGDYYVTTGPNNPQTFANCLLRIDPYSGTVLQTVMYLGQTVSDICFVDEQFGSHFGFVGLDNNNNRLVWIPYVSGSFQAPVTVPLTGISRGYTTSGLTWTRSSCNNFQHELLVTASSPSSAKAIVYSVDPVAANATILHYFIGAEFQGAHVANGWIYCSEELQVGHKNKNLGNFTFSSFPYSCVPLPNWANYVGPVFDNAPFEDFCTLPYNM